MAKTLTQQEIQRSHTPECHYSYVSRVSFSRNGKTLASAIAVSNQL